MTDAARIEKARRLLSEPASRPSAWGLLAAAGLMALSAVLMAGTIVLGPGFGV
ncbi:peptidoglycan-binding protein [Brevundimonas sp. S30B]|uniref:peptidoglycan-binding protein n=1 Tax=unclassified Brevundimonas TaxID=2622653 RepID=UPI0010722CB5|nr:MULTISPECIES: peptidoglycan-binding protein [unclassified Brevundimonas]QBX37930.1 peptidoglycan-binding protein [Brevundimonas sp. MF30-B]TFW02715.1 peptidoglycan-binding protein [Brevundimonas sp. S30B]